MIPTLTTNRLTLRAPSEKDLPVSEAFFATERSHFVGGPAEPWEVWGKLAGALGQWALRGYGRWTFDLGDQPAGWVGIIHPADWPEAEIGWGVYDGFEGQGLAFEAAQAARDYAAQHWGLTRLISLIDPANTRSARLAKRLGAEPESETTIRGHQCQIWRHPAPAAPILPEEIETDRLILRRPVEADRAAYVTFYSSPRSAMAHGPFDTTGANTYFDQELALWEDKGFGMHSLFVKDAPNTPIGLAGVWQPKGWTDPELGWLLWEGTEGKGYASEAAQAMRDLIFARGWPKLVSYIHHNNTGSIAVAKRLGATPGAPHPTFKATDIWHHRRDAA